MTFVDPHVLQAIALGTKDDPYLPDGRHIRWYFNRLLGFPRSGFRLKRRPSPLVQDWANPPGVPVTRRQDLGAAELGAGKKRRFASGLTVSKAGGFEFGPVTSGTDPLLRVNDRIVAFDFGAEGATPPVSGELLSNPAAYVLLTLTRRAFTGYVEATGYWGALPGRRFVDRGAVGAQLPPHLWDYVTVFFTGRGRVARVLSSAERAIAPEMVTRRDSSVADVLDGSPRRVRWTRPPWFFDFSPWVTETILLHGGLLEHVEVSGRDAALISVQWITTRDELAATGWTDLGVFHLPLTDAPAIYPAWTSDAGSVIARKRLELAPPKVVAPWDDSASPVLSALERRYLGAAGEEFKDVDAAMRAFLEGELQKVVPQALVEVTEALEPEPGDDTGPEELNATVSPFDFLYGSAADPQMARILGLMTTDFDAPAQVFDYAVEAAFPILWLKRLLTPKLAAAQADELRDLLNGAPIPWTEHADQPVGTAPIPRPFAPHPCASLVTGIVRAAAPLPSPPEDVQAVSIADALKQPVQARADVSWRREQGSLFDRPERVRVLYAFRRATAGAGALLHHKDDETGLLAPHLPTPHADLDDRLRLSDRNVPTYGSHTWEVAGMDLFGRMSAFAPATTEVKDVVPPPPPAAVEAELRGDESGAPIWTNLVVRFDWPKANATLAPDLARFEVHVRQLDVAPGDAPLATTWGVLEHAPGATAAPFSIGWPAANPGPLPAGIAATTAVTPLDDGGDRITLEIGPVQVPFDPEGFAHVSVAVVALDGAGNASAFSVPGRTARADAAPPPTPPAPETAQRATVPDSRNRSFFRVALPPSGDGFMQVMRVSGAALLAEGGTSAAAFEAMSESAQVARLKELAAVHPERFTPDHEIPYPAGSAAHLMELGGFDRGMTVATIIPLSRTHVRASWPTSPSQFIVIVVPRPAVPRAPWVRRVHAGDRSVRLSIEPDVNGLTRTLHVYRARGAEAAADVRRMKPLDPVDVDVASVNPTEIVDSGLWPDADYFYRVVAVGADDSRSLPTEAFLARPFGTNPEPPVIAAIDRDAALPARRRVTCVIARRDYRLRLFRRDRSVLAWEAPQANGIDPRGFVDLAVLVPAPASPGGYQFIVDDVVPAADRPYAYFLRVEDPRGNAAESVPMVEPA